MAGSRGEGPSARPAGPRRSIADIAVRLLTVTVVLDYADRSALGAVAPALRDDLRLNLADLGYLGAAFGLVGGVATVLAGVQPAKHGGARRAAGPAGQGAGQ